MFNQYAAAWQSVRRIQMQRGPLYCSGLIQSYQDSSLSNHFPKNLITMDNLRSLVSTELYTVGWIAALAHEWAAAVAMLEERHGKPQDYEKRHSDTNTYHWGQIGGHNVVITLLAAGVIGTTSAATTAIFMLSSFPNIKMGLMVGIGAAIARPLEGQDIRLGDVVVSQPGEDSGGVVQYDLGKSSVTNSIRDGGHPQHKIELRGSLNSPPLAVLKALNVLKGKFLMEKSKIQQLVKEMLERFPDMAENENDDLGYSYQGQHRDRLFEASCLHTGRTGCKDCDSSGEVRRDARRNPDRPRIHYGVIASGNILVKDAADRDSIFEKTGEKCLCIEMEAAGLMNDFPCLVVRGICDYADSHKNDRWQTYAAATAAAFAKEFLRSVDNADLARTPKASDVMRES